MIRDRHEFRQTYEDYMAIEAIVNTYESQSDLTDAEKAAQNALSQKSAELKEEIELYKSQKRK